MDNISLTYSYLNDLDWNDELFKTSTDKKGNTIHIIRCCNLKAEIDGYTAHNGGKLLGGKTITKQLRKLSGVISTDKQFPQNDGSRPRCFILNKELIMKEINKMFEGMDDDDMDDDDAYKIEIPESRCSLLDA
jgi:hypothetical protein